MEAFTPKVTLTSIDTNEEVQVTLSYDSVATGPYAPANLLFNGDFESRSTLGWATASTVTAAVAPDGSNALQLTAYGGFSAPSAYQSVPADPGDEFTLSGMLYTGVTLPSDATFGLLKIVFTDELGNDLPPASVSVGVFADPAYPGAESRPLLNAASPIGSWEFSEVQAVAPDDTASVHFFVINIDESANTIYADSIQAVEVAEVPLLGEIGFFRVRNSGR